MLRVIKYNSIQVEIPKGRQKKQTEMGNCLKITIAIYVDEIIIKERFHQNYKVIIKVAKTLR